MAEDNKIKFELNLDNKDFLDALAASDSTLKKFGENGQVSFKNLTSGVLNLAEGFSGLVGQIAGATAIVAGLHKAFETILEVEKLKMIDQQFELLSQSAGVFGQKLKDDVLSAVKGLATEGEVLQTLNKALIEMPQNAERFGELMQVSLKVSKVFGGDLVQTFDELSHAIAMGSERQLKAHGIIIDTAAAYKKYAQSIGVAVSALSEQEKQTALLNEVIEYGNKRFKDVDESLIKNNITFKQLKGLLSEIIEVGTRLFESVFGDLLYKALSNLKDFASLIYKTLKSDTKGSIEEVQNAIETYSGKIARTRAEIEQLNNLHKNGSIYAVFYKLRIEALNKKLSEYQTKLDEALESEKKFQEQKKEAEKTLEKPVDTEAIKLRKKQNEEFLADLTKLRQQEIELHNQTINTLTSIDVSYTERKKLLYQKNQDEVNAIRNSDKYSEEQKVRLIEQVNANLQANLQKLELARHQERLKLIDEQIKTSTSLVEAEALFEQKKFELTQFFNEQKKAIQMNEALSDEQRKLMELELERQHKAQLLQIHQEYENQKIQVTQNAVAAANSAADQFAKGFEAAAYKARKNLTDFGAQGQQVFGILTNSFGNAFIKMGEGSKKGSQVMREAMLGMIADIAQYYGQMMLAASVLPPNPAGLAAGAALLALAGYLRSQAKGTTAFTGVGGVGGMGGGIEMGNVGASQDLRQEERKEKAYQITILGNYFETEQTKQRLLELMREASDATDFKYTKIGGGI